MLAISKVLFSDEELTKMAQIIEAGEGSTVQWSRSYMFVVEFYADGCKETQFRMGFLSQIALIISIVSFKNKRCGTMSELLDFIIEKCKEHGIQKIVIQCVLTEEMASFCLKHGFSPNTNTGVMRKGTHMLKEYLSGDYELSLKEATN